ncbi:A-kinase anchor protein 1, mitochondrial-like [Porphyrio hochstetteri]
MQPASGQVQEELSGPTQVQALVGRLIGKQGRFMNFLKQESGAKLSLIGKKFKSLRLTNVSIPPEGVPVEVVVANQVDAGHMFLQETGEVELRYVDYGGYDRVKINQLRKIRSDFLSLPFQAAEVLLDNVVPLADEDHFSPQADAAVAEMTKGAVLVAQFQVMFYIFCYIWDTYTTMIYLASQESTYSMFLRQQHI